jgi:hypothetical protein
MKKKRMTTKMSNRLLLRTVMLALTFTLAAAGNVAGQNLDPKKPYALIFGTVFGPDDRPAAYVKIKIRRGDQKKAKWELMSDKRGEFAQRFPAGPAEYFVSTHADKKYGLENKEVRVQITSDERQDIALHLTKAETTEHKGRDKK